MLILVVGVDSYRYTRIAVPFRPLDLAMDLEYPVADWRDVQGTSKFQKFIR